jgi:SAM-dependent methyltransferase
MQHMTASSSSEEPAVLGDSALQSAQLEELTDAVNYRSWLVSLALPYLGERPLEVGSGNGDYAAEFASLGLKITASEAEPVRAKQLAERFRTTPDVTVRELVLPASEKGDYSAVVAYNVLEHIADDVAAVRGMAELLRPGGAVVLLVPAFMFAFSDLDERIGHQRRYRLRDVRHVCQAAGLTVERIHYVNSLGLLAWFVGMRLLRLTPHSGPILKLWDSLVIPLLRRVERRWHPPFGQSVFVVARSGAAANLSTQSA